jgi:hypothetical protein
MHQTTGARAAGQLYKIDQGLPSLRQPRRKFNQSPGFPDVFSSEREAIILFGLIGAVMGRSIQLRIKHDQSRRFPRIFFFFESRIFFCESRIFQVREKPSFYFDGLLGANMRRSTRDSRG